MRPLLAHTIEDTSKIKYPVLVSQKLDGAKICMTLPRELPADLDYDWYVAEAVSMLEDMGVVVDKTKVTV